MRTRTAVYIALMIMTNCTSTESKVPPPTPVGIPVMEMEMHEVYVVTIDSCEYLYGRWGNGTWVTHKGNCTNPIHKR